MNKTKTFSQKTFSLVLAVMLIITAFTSVSAFSASAKVERGVISSWNDYYINHKEVCDKIAEGISNFESEINIREFNILRTDASNLFFSTLNSYPELFNAKMEFSYSWINRNDKYINCVYPIYSCEKSEFEQNKKNFDEKIEKYLSKVDDSMTDFQKALILHDEIILNSSYAFSDSIYDFVTNGSGNCTCYSRTYSYLLSLVGINSEIVSSDEMNHAWNKIEIGGEYYNVDVTWDDPTYDKLGFAQHNNFLFSDDAFLTGNNGKCKKHFGFDDSFYKATSTKYDDFDILHETSSKFNYVNGSFYCIDNKYKSKYENDFLKYNETDDSFEILREINGRWWDIPYRSYWNGGYSSLDSYGTLLYFNTDNEIYYYDIETGIFEKYQTDISLNGKCYGLLIKDEKMYAAIADNPNVVGEWVLVGDCIKKEEPVLIKGDVDCSGDISINDATTIQKYLAGIIKLNDAQLAAADVNSDGVVNVADATYIQKILARLI